jgi:hypothetical protein
MLGWSHILTWALGKVFLRINVRGQRFLGVALSGPDELCGLLVDWMLACILFIYMFAPAPEILEEQSNILLCCLFLIQRGIPPLPFGAGRVPLSAEKRFSASRH